jgi:hypothetical protein
VLSQIKGKQVPAISYIPSKAIIRQSCGCFPHSIAYVDSAIKYHIFNPVKPSAHLEIDQKKILDHTVRELESINIDNKILYEWLKKVLQSIISCINRGDYQDKELYRIITQLPILHTAVFDNEAFWYNIIRILYLDIVFVLQDNNAMKVLELIYQKAKLFLSELFQKPDPFQIMNEKEMVWRLHDSSNVLTTSFDLNQLLAEIADRLPYLGIKTGYISFYKDQVKQKSDYIWDIPQESKLLLMFDDDRHFSMTDGEIVFPTLELIPKKYFAFDKRFTFIIMPLFFKNEHFGFIILELGARVETIYDTLRGYISSSLKGALNFQKQIEVEELLTQKKEDLSLNLEKIQKAMGAFIQTMNSTMEVRDPYTANHQVRVSDLARKISTEMKLDHNTIESIRMAGVIHDLGKICVPAEILNKPGRLTVPEFDIIKSHPKIAYDIIKHIDFPWPIAEIILQHHERLDGSGYPQHLKNKKILLEAQILAVADTVEAMATHRPYRPALGIDKTLAEINKNKGILYNAEAVDACVRLFRGKGYTFR